MGTMKRILPFLVVVLGLAAGCEAGWLNPTQQGFVIQTFTTYQPITGNNSGTIVTNGNSLQVAGDNTGLIYIGGPGSQFRGKNDGNVHVDGDGALVMGTFGSLAVVTNRGKGSLLLGNLSVGQKAVITDVGNASILLGAGVVSNSQAIVVGDGNESHGLRSVTADSFWGMGSGFHGDGSALTGITAAQVGAAATDHTQAASTITGLGSASTNATGDFATAAQGARADQAGYTPEVEFGFDGAGKITSYTGTNAELRIPPTIGGVPVTEIGMFAFEGKTSIVRLFLPASVKTVGPYTFDECSELTAADMPGATYIGHSAFKNCYKLASVAMPNVVYIEDNAFISCFALTALSLPSVQTIGSGAYSFFNCTNLVTVSMPVVTSIAAHTFLGCTKLASVYFSGNAPNLGSYVDPFTGATISGVFEGTAPAIAYYPQGRTGYSTWGYTNTNTWVQTDNIYSLSVNGAVPDAEGKITIGSSAFGTIGGLPDDNSALSNRIALAAIVAASGGDVGEGSFSNVDAIVMANGVVIGQGSITDPNSKKVFEYVRTGGYACRKIYGTNGVTFVSFDSGGMVSNVDALVLGTHARLENNRFRDMKGNTILEYGTGLNTPLRRWYGTNGTTFIDFASGYVPAASVSGLKSAAFSDAGDFDPSNAAAQAVGGYSNIAAGLFASAVQGAYADDWHSISTGVGWKTNVWWAYATSNATEMTAFTNVYLGR